MNLRRFFIIKDQSYALIFKMIAPFFRKKRQKLKHNLSFSVFLWRDAGVLLKIPVEAAQGSITHLVGTFQHRTVGICQNIACLADAVLVNILIKGDPGYFFEVAGYVGITERDGLRKCI